MGKIVANAERKQAKLSRKVRAATMAVRRQFVMSANEWDYYLEQRLTCERTKPSANATMTNEQASPAESVFVAAGSNQLCTVEWQVYLDESGDVHIHVFQTEAEARAFAAAHSRPEIHEGGIQGKRPGLVRKVMRYTPELRHGSQE